MTPTPTPSRHRALTKTPNTALSYDDTTLYMFVLCLPDRRTDIALDVQLQRHFSCFYPGYLAGFIWPGRKTIIAMMRTTYTMMRSSACVNKCTC
jgi:hypothetical protein